MMLLKTTAYHLPTKGWPVSEHQPLGILLPPLFAEHSPTGCGISCSAGVSCAACASCQCLTKWREEEEEEERP